jgi:hypothetical protein
MKTIITSNWRPLCRAACTVLLCSAAALWVMPRSARAQLYVGQHGGDIVGEYDATTGAAINANLITNAEGLSFPAELALSGNDLFVANLGVSSGGGTTVGEYNLTTGTFNGNFITGLDDHFGLALSGNDLFVSNGGPGRPGTVGKYNAATGAAMNASFITGLNNPEGLALSGNTLFVVNEGANAVGEYDATTGAAINPNFITGLNYPIGLAVAPVPEPSTWSMIAVAGVVLLGIMCRKKHLISADPINIWPAKFDRIDATCQRRHPLVPFYYPNGVLGLRPGATILVARRNGCPALRSLERSRNRPAHISE